MQSNCNIEKIEIVAIGLDEMRSAPASVRKYLAEQFGNFLNEDLFIESVSTHIDQGQSPERTKRIIDFLRDFTIL